MENTPEVGAPRPASKPKKNSFWSEIVTFLIIAVCIVLPFRIFIAEPYIVSGTSMYPTFNTGHYLIVDKISYRLHAPKRFDVVVMIFPKDESKDFIKRVIGLPGETVKIVNGKVTIINAANPDGMLLDDSFVTYPKNDDNQTTTLKDDEYFVMGDNRAGSYDSRYWGPLPKKDIVGYPILRLYPFSQISITPGSIQ